MILALSGGVGGARLASGLASLVPPQALHIIVNTGDDFEHLGLFVCPDLDTVMYSLAGCADPERGWGVVNESWSFMESLRQLGGCDWFALGDRDLAVHVQRSLRLRDGVPLSEVTAELCQALKVAPHIVPMSELPAPTVVESDCGVLGFQEYFVRERCKPHVHAIRHPHPRVAPQPFFLECLQSASLEAVILCPSNPFLSIDPILNLEGVYEALSKVSAPIVAVSPIICGRALRGPASKIMQELGLAQDACAVAQHYVDLIDVFVIDRQDRRLAAEIEALGISVRVAQTVMDTPEKRHNLAREVLDFVSGKP